jgi:hypothetical protein
MITNNDFKTISELDLDPIKVKLMHAESGEGWTLEKANAVAFEYRRFLYLMKKFPTEQTAPLVDVDTFWHYHILDTMKYEADCQAVFGYFLHHFPYIGLRGEDDEVAHQRIGARMQELYEETFGEPYIRSEASPRSAGLDTSAMTAWSAVAIKTAQSQLAGTTAWSAVAIKTAQPLMAGMTAWSAVAAKRDWLGAATSSDSRSAELARFYSERPTLETLEAVA